MQQMPRESNQRQADLPPEHQRGRRAVCPSHNQPVERPQPTRAVQLGDTVELLKLGTKASVIAINKDGTLYATGGNPEADSQTRRRCYLLEDAN